MLDADIYVIQECENPDSYKKQFENFYSDFIWCGEKSSKGLAIFLKPGISFKVNDWPVYCLRHFTSINVEGNFDLLGVWAGPPYIEEYYIYQAINIDKFDHNTVIIGDFNSNAIWDKSHGKRNHSAVVEQLIERNIYSAYHHVYGEMHGQESQSTFYMYKHKDKKYHIDYCFLNPAHLKEFQILNSDEWLKYSDHMPILVEIF